MNLDALIKQFWGELYPENVVYLSTYRLERARRYPGVSIRPFKDYKAHKRWMLEEMKRLGRKAHNDRVLAEFKASQKPKGPA